MRFLPRFLSPRPSPQAPTFTVSANSLGESCTLMSTPRPALATTPVVRQANRLNRINALYENALWNQQNQRQWWLADYWSAKSANNFWTRRQLRVRSRQELSNNPILFGVCTDNATHLVGTGPTVQVDTGNPDWDRALLARWREWADEVSFAQRITTLKLARTVDGEGFIVLINSRRMECPVKLWPKDIEADQVTTLEPGNLLELWIDGLTLDPQTGEPVTYHYLKSHPGDFFFPGLNPLDSIEIPAKYMVHWFKKFRPGQVRGIPIFTPSLDLWTELRSFRKAVVASANLCADYTVLLESAAATGAPAGTDPQQGSDPEYYPFYTVPLDRGMETVLPGGMTAKQMEPLQPAATYEMFHYLCVGESCRPLSFPLNLALGTSQKFNFSSAKLDHVNYRSGLDVERSECDAVALDRIFRVWYEEASLIPGYLPRGMVEALMVRGRLFRGAPVHKWHWPPYAPLDPYVEAQTTALKIATRQLTWAQFCASETSETYVEHFEQVAKEDELLREKGIEVGEPAKLTIHEDADPDFKKGEGEPGAEERLKRGGAADPKNKRRQNTHRGHHKEGQYAQRQRISANDFDESKVHRGQPENSGQFGPGGGGGGADDAESSPEQERIDGLTDAAGAYESDPQFNLEPPPNEMIEGEIDPENQVDWNEHYEACKKMPDYYSDFWGNGFADDLEVVGVDAKEVGRFNKFIENEKKKIFKKIEPVRKAVAKVGSAKAKWEGKSAVKPKTNEKDEVDRQQAIVDAWNEYVDEQKEASYKVQEMQDQVNSSNYDTNSLVNSLCQKASGRARVNKPEPEPEPEPEKPADGGEKPTEASHAPKLAGV